MGLLAKLGKSALRGGPKPSAARIAELQARGFNTELPLFRGTGFDIEKEIEAGRAIHLSDSPHYASAYAAGFDSPFDYRPDRQEIGASMSREAHERLREQVAQEYKSITDAISADDKF